MIPIITKLINSIKNSENIKRIILFGSRARNDAEERSDIDIAVDCPNISEQEWLLICDKIEKFDTLLKIDIVRFDTASKELQTKILQEGIILYEKH